LEGDLLAQQLRKDVAVYMRAPIDSIPTHVGLTHIGMDSLTLSQLSGALSTQYGFHIKDEHMFAEGLSIAWMVHNAAALRESDSLVPPHEAAVHATAEANPALAGTAETGAPMSTVATTVLPRRSESWFQRNCPCCVWCY
jgi:acyl carrier protein